MDETMLVKLSHLRATYRSMDVIANNIANASTPGFKRESVRFEELVKKLPPGEGETQPEPVSFVRDAGVVRDLSQGRFDETGAQLDFAINGDGYFVIETPAGERYTRNGHFLLDKSGRLCTSNGASVAGEGGEIIVAPDDGDLHVANDGTLSSRRGIIGKLRIVSFADERALKRDGSSLFATDQPTVPAKGRILQGAVEASNVEPVVEISRMIEVMRAYEATANLLKDENNNELERLGSLPS